MTFWHFVNTMALCFAPPYLMYRALLQEYSGALGTVVTCGLYLVATQLARMIFLGAVGISSSLDESTSFQITTVSLALVFLGFQTFSKCALIHLILPTHFDNTFKLSTGNPPHLFAHV